MNGDMVLKGIKNPVKAAKYIRRKARTRKVKKWTKKHSMPAEKYFSDIDADLWDEALEYSKSLESELQNKYQGEISTADFHPDAGVGGGAATEILYFFTRHKRPQIVVETGVSAGWSSRAILDALQQNKKGTLYSNDLPYSERPSKEGSLHPSEEQIGIVVSQELEGRWELYIGPDKDNLSKIISNIDSVDIFHYDSDKSYEGRDFAMEAIKKKLHDNSIVVMDDITDNSYFKDFTRRENVEWKVLDPPSGGPVGIIRGKW